MDLILPGRVVTNNNNRMYHMYGYMYEHVWKDGDHTLRLTSVGRSVLLCFQGWGNADNEGLVGSGVALREAKRRLRGAR
jgi:hypothetical protein